MTQNKQWYLANVIAGVMLLLCLLIGFSADAKMVVSETPYLTSGTKFENVNGAGAGDASFGAAIISSTVLQIKSYFSDTFEADSIMTTLPINLEVYP